MRDRPHSLLGVIAVRMLTVTAIWLALMLAFVQSDVERNAAALRSQTLERTARLLAANVTRADDGLRFTPSPGELPAGYLYA
ncbi:MAG: hypothetical protein ACK5UV_00980, partial [bacterium]